MPEVDLQALVTRLTLGPADLKPGFTTELTPNGDKVTGQVTFNNCGYRFTSETHRVARRQVVIVDNKNQPAGVSNEIIAYDTPQAAASALAQYRESVTTCNLKTVHTFAATNTPSFRYDISNTEISPNLPVTDNAIIILGVQTTNPPIRHDYQVIIIQHQGTVLDILYFPTTARPTLKSLNEATPLGVLVGHKLTKAIPNH